MCVCCEENRRDYLQDHGWRYWPADGSFARNNETSRHTLQEAFALETAGAKVCPVCSGKLP
jgi:hypothetical protein